MKHFLSLLRGWPAALVILLLLAGPAVRAQGWQSALPIEADETEYLMTTDAAGNIYIARNFSGSIVLIGNNALIANASYQAMVVAKWSPITRAFVWAYRVTGNGSVYPSALVVEGNSVYVAGKFSLVPGSSTTMSFGSIPVSSSGSYDGFVTKLTDAGQSASFTWAKHLGGSGEENVTALAVSGGSVYVAGTFASAPAQFDAASISAVGQGNVFVSRLLDAGTTATFAWATGAGGTGIDAATAVTVNGSSVYVTGSYGSTSATFGNTTLTRNPAGTYNLYDLFVAKLTDTGTQASFVWALGAGGSDIDASTLIAVAGPNVYIGGKFNSATATFGTVALVNTDQQNFTYDGFVAKVTDTGPTASFSWATRTSGSTSEGLKGLVVNGSGVYAAGFFDSPSLVLGNTTLTRMGLVGYQLLYNYDIFVTRLQDNGSSGSFTWALGAGSPNVDAVDMLAVTGNHLVVAGIGNYPLTFGSLTVPPPTPRTGVGLYVATLTDPLLTAATSALSSAAFTLSPNPARTTATVQLPAVPGATTATLTLTDALGRIIRTEIVALPAAGLRHELDLRGLAPGLYAVQVRAGSTSGTQRLVVE